MHMSANLLSLGAIDFGIIIDGAVVMVRQLFQGKLNADVGFGGEAPYFASIQAGAFRAENAVSAESPVAVESVPVQLDAAKIRSRPHSGLGGKLFLT